MATIEPRLMHLLNDSKPAGSTAALDLPPIQDFPFTNPSHSLSLPPLELDGGQRGENASPKGLPISQQIPPLSALAGEDPGSRPVVSNEGTCSDAASSRHKTSTLSLRLLLDNRTSGEPSRSLRMILDDTTDNADDLSNKKRHRSLTTKEELIQLPQPLKKQKSSQQVGTRQQVVPPIINGLHEPPPDAAVFPPISSAQFDDSETPNLNLASLNLASAKERGTILYDVNATSNQGEAEKKGRRKGQKPRRKWTEEETNHLLLGVSRHGVGKWTSILEDSDFVFDNRTAGDLKDRFRTCCPHELWGNLPKEDMAAETATTATLYPRLRSSSSLNLESILDVADLDRDKGITPAQQEVDNLQKPKRSRAHRKKVEDLVELGIRGPFKKSVRRERRHFTDQDDKEILDGLHAYGPAWTKIQRDTRFHLSSRQPTDLRDRVRNKYPEIYARIEKLSPESKETAKSRAVLEPSVSTTIENSLVSTKPGPLEPSLNRSSSKEDMPRWLQPSTSLEELNEPPSTSLLGTSGEMDISRLLLDDSQISAEPKAD